MKTPGNKFFKIIIALALIIIITLQAVDGEMKPSPPPTTSVKELKENLQNAFTFSYPGGLIENDMPGSWQRGLEASTFERVLMPDGEVRRGAPFWSILKIISAGQADRARAAILWLKYDGGLRNGIKKISETYIENLPQKLDSSGRTLRHRAEKLLAALDAIEGMGKTVNDGDRTAIQDFIKEVEWQLKNNSQK